MAHCHSVCPIIRFVWGGCACVGGSTQQGERAGVPASARVVLSIHAWCLLSPEFFQALSLSAEEHHTNRSGVLHLSARAGSSAILLGCKGFVCKCDWLRKPRGCGEGL